jgi:hypothetical protein
MESMSPVKFWICLAVIGSVLGTVTTLSVQEVPSAGGAIVAIRVAHLEVVWARIVFRDPAVEEAEVHLNRAWSNLKARRYEQSVLAAGDGLRRVRDIKGGVPWLAMSQREKNRDEPGSSPES